MTGVIGGRYRLVEQVGAGGMGVVWRARDEVLGREVAVKRVRLAPELDEPERRALCERALDEARTAAMLRHPSIVTVHDLVIEDGDPAIVMELVHGPSLEQVIRDHGPLPVSRAAEIGLRVLSALEAAHAAGVLHRDVKPANVLLAGDGRVVLSDFGIATLAGGQVGTPVGTPGFTAPECLVGGPEGGVGPASDLWSLGATVYAAVEGRGPFTREGALATIGAVLTEPPAPSSSPLWPVLRAVLDKDPARRPAVAELRAHLEAAAQGSDVTAVLSEAERPARSEGVSLPVAAGSMLAAVLVGAGAVLVPQLGTAPSAEPSAIAATPSASPSPSREPGRFAALPRACSLLTEDQVAETIPQALTSPEGNDDCLWSRIGIEAENQSMQLKLELVEPTPTRAEVPLAADEVAARRADAERDRGSTYLGMVSDVTDLRGVGDEAITWTVTSGDRYRVMIVFRVSNVVAELRLERRGEDAALRGKAEAAARSIAEALRK